MKRFLAASLIAFLIGTALGIAAAVAPARLFFPHVANGAVTTRLVKLIDHDAGFVNAVATPDCRYFVDYQTRPDGHVHLTEQVGDVLISRQVLTDTLALAPAAAELPGPKQGAVSQTACGGEIRTYFTGRAPDDLSGPFYVWVLIEPIPPIVRFWGSGPSRC